MLQFIAKISVPNIIILILLNLKRHRHHWQKTYGMSWTDLEHLAHTKDINAVVVKAS